jgi:hypothetical protein
LVRTLDAFAARAFARAAQIGANRRIEAYAKSLLRHQRNVAAPELQIHQSKNRGPAIGPARHWAAARQLKGA